MNLSELKPGMLVKTNNNLDESFWCEDGNTVHIFNNSILVFLDSEIVFNKFSKNMQRVINKFLFCEVIIIYFSYDEADNQYLLRNLTEVVYHDKK